MRTLGAFCLEVKDIRRELERPLVRFRGAVAGFSDEMRAPSWDPEFVGDVEAVLVREVEPAVLEIEEMVRENRFLAQLAPRMTRPQDWAAGARSVWRRTIWLPSPNSLHSQSTAG